ncbi:g13015 [Coccomyxa viridis]|uniref:Glycine cleavage system H protein n=1 Tax=Coccomyxa viridis TaxID=1274662 RepID=A0ABP1GED5_9CHLO
MALRQLAATAAQRTGLCWASPTASQVGSNVSIALRTVFARGFATVEQGYSYAGSHEWVKVDGDTATIGISDFAQAELGDIVYVELPEAGSEVEKGNNFGVVESVKAASDVYSPVSGEVLESNQALADEPGKVNSEPFSGGWMLKVKLTDPSQVDSLMDASAYEKHCEENAH